jgi:hypothetical protein
LGWCKKGLSGSLICDVFVGITRMPHIAERLPRDWEPDAVSFLLKPKRALGKVLITLWHRVSYEKSTILILP